MSTARVSKRAGRVVAPALLLTALFATSAVAQPRAREANPVRGLAQGKSVALDGRLQVLIEDYLHDAGTKFAALSALNLATIGGGAFGIFSVAALAFGGNA